ncbi:hypothetical protein D3C80_2194260 [compost metagenome]
MASGLGAHTHSPMQGYNLILADLTLSVYLNSGLACHPSDFNGGSIGGAVVADTQEGTIRALRAARA